MAIYYVSQSTGLNTNNGTSPVTPWQTLAFALGAASGTNPGLVGGDIVYVAPGSYNEAVTVGMTSASSTVQIIGDPLNAQGFPSVNGGVILWWHLTSAALTATSKNNLSFSNIYFERATATNSISIVCTTCYSWTFNKCIIVGGVSGTSVSPNALNWTNTKSVVCAANGQNGIGFTTGSGTAYNINININDCLFFSNTGGGATANIGVLSGVGNGGIVSNCTMMHSNVNAQMGTSNTTDKLMFQNCLFLGNSSFFINPAGQINSQYNRYVNNLGFNGVSGTGSTTGGLIGLDFGNARLLGYGLNDFFGSNAGAANIGFGTATNAPVSDLYGATWLTTPDAGAVQRSALSNFQPPTAPYVAAERNASTITIAPGSTSQSIELYLGSTGITASTAGLSARYNRTRTASVNIPLVARTIGQAWISGGFAEVDAVNMPGIYRVDIPDAALAAGADDVTLVVRGASGTNGAVMTVKLSSGGLTSAQTASAVWGTSPGGYNDATTFGGVLNETNTLANDIETVVQDVPNQVWNELTSNHTTHGTFGWNLLRADQQSKQGLVTLHASGGINRVDADVHAIVNDTDAAIELKGALLHNGTDYISADLLSPTSPATTLRMGPYSVVADQTKQEINVDILTGASLPVVLQLVDANGTGIPLTGATLSVKIYTTSGTLVTTYTGTASYADAGFVTFTLTSAVTATPGTYYVTVTRSSGATDTSIYGGLRLYVRSN